MVRTLQEEVDVVASAEDMMVDVVAEEVDSTVVEVETVEEEGALEEIVEVFEAENVQVGVFKMWLEFHYWFQVVTTESVVVEAVGTMETRVMIGMYIKMNASRPKLH